MSVYTQRERERERVSSSSKWSGHLFINEADLRLLMETFQQNHNLPEVKKQPKR